MDTLAMQRIRGFLRICFGYLALVSALLCTFMLTSLFWRTQHPHVYRNGYQGHFGSAAAMVLNRIVRLFPIPMVVIYGMAWWKLKRGRRFARVWAIAASALMVLSSAATLLARLSLWPAGRHFRSSFLFLQLFLIAIGVLGLIVFAKTHPASMQVAAKPARIRGDGTSSFLDLAVSVLALAGLWGGMIAYARWGHAQKLPFTRGSVSLPAIALVLLITVVLHEAAHAGAGLALGMKVRAFVIGPFQWRIRDGRWQFRFNLVNFSFGGATGVVPRNPDQSRWVEIAMIAAGPLSNLFTGIAAIWLTISAKGHSWERFWEPLAFFATVNLVTCAVNLIPFRPDALYSDGARIYQLLSGGPWACLHRAYSFILSSTVTQLRPKNYDLDAILRAEEHFSHGREGMMLRLFATNHYFDIGKSADARASYAEALRICQESQVNIPTDLLPTFVFNSVYLDRDAATARRFWDLFESKSPTHFGVDYWLSRTALHWIEGHLLESRDAWATGSALAEQLPDAGAYNFDRDRYRKMQELLDAPLNLPVAECAPEPAAEAHAAS